MTREIGTAVGGYAYWGPNLARNVAECSGLALRALCDADSTRLEVFAQRHPEARAVSNLDQLLADPEIEAVILATPPQTHHALARQVLEAGRHVLVEKPLATCLSDAHELAHIARQSERLLMPGHTFVYSPAVNAVRELIQSGVVGDVHFITSARMNLGKYHAGGVLCDLAPHDLSILLHWLEEPVVEVAASGSSVL